MTWTSFISLNRFLGPVDDSGTTDTKSQSHKDKLDDSYNNSFNNPNNNAYNNAMKFFL